MLRMTILTRGYGPTDRPTDQPTDRPTDIATYRAAIAAKKEKLLTKQKVKSKSIDKNEFLCIKVYTKAIWSLQRALR